MDIRLIITGDGRTAELPCGSVTLKSKRLAAAGTMEVFTPDKSVPLRCGMEARLSVEGTDVFAGYLFTVGAERGGRTLIAADSMRYLLCKDTKAYVNLSAAEIVRDICGERGLTLGTAEDGGVKLEELTCDQQTLLDIISTAIDESEKMGGGRLTLFDDAGVLRLMREETLPHRAYPHRGELPLRIPRDRRDRTGHLQPHPAGPEKPQDRAAGVLRERGRGVDRAVGGLAVQRKCTAKHAGRGD